MSSCLKATVGPFCFVLLTVITSEHVLSQSREEWTEKSASAWMKTLEYSVDSMKLIPHQSINKKEFAKQYHFNPGRWEKAFAFLSNTGLDTISPGRYLIDGDDVFAVITDTPSKLFDTSRWEGHKNFTDIHYVIRGREKIGVAPAATAKIDQPYMPARDLLYYKTKGKYFLARPGTYFVFFPTDAHRPNIRVEGYEVVKKIYIKIRNQTESEILKKP